MTATPRYLPLPAYHEYRPAEMVERARSFADDVARRRTVRAFSQRPVTREVIEHCLRAAGSAPSGANMQPWHFVVVGRDATLRRRIRDAAEAEERTFYRERAPKVWLEALAPLGTDEHKPFLDVAPWLIAIFARRYDVRPDGAREPNYYVTESVGIATGILVTALHHAGLVSLTHTPSPMGFLNELLGRPDNEKPFLLLVTGYPAADATVPEAALRKQPLNAIATFLE